MFKTGVIMTSGPMGDDEGLLTEEEAAAILQLSLQRCASFGWPDQDHRM